MASLLKGAVFAALLAYNAVCVRDMARAAAQAFLAPQGVGAPLRPDAPLPSAALAAHNGLRFVADMHASPMMSARDVLVRLWRAGERAHPRSRCVRHVAPAASRLTHDLRCTQARAPPRCSWRKCTRSHVVRVAGAESRAVNAHAHASVTHACRTCRA
jgi:hypothetical protein